jgi:putative acetyltransferase
VIGYWKEIIAMDLRPLQPDDALAVSALLATAFDGPMETRLVSQLRQDGAMALELVAADAGRTYGYIGFCKLTAPGDWWSLSPVAVSPSRQGGGIGSELIRYGLDHARRAGARAVTVLGDPVYYRRFGFTCKAAENLTSPYSGPNYMLYPIAPLTAGIAAEVTYPEAFWSL